MRQLAALAVGLQAGGAGVWWIALSLQPALRVHFRPAQAAGSALFAFALPDLLLFTFAGLLAAAGMWGQRRWAWPLLVLTPAPPSTPRSIA